MKPISFNRSSWHYKLATEWGDLNKCYETTNICHYTRQVLRGLLLATVAALMVAFITGFVLFIVAQTIAMWAFILIEGNQSAVELHSAGVAGTMMLGIVLAGWLFDRAFKWANRWTYARQQQREFKSLSKEDSFVATGWQAWRQKMCMRVNIIDDTAPQEQE